MMSHFVTASLAGGFLLPRGFFLIVRSARCVCGTRGRASASGRVCAAQAATQAVPRRRARCRCEGRWHATRPRTRRARARAAAAPSAARAAASASRSAWSALGCFLACLPIWAFDRLLCAGISRRQSRCETCHETHNATSGGQARRNPRAARSAVRKGAERAVDAEGHACRERPLFASRGSPARV